MKKRKDGYPDIKRDGKGYVLNFKPLEQILVEKKRETVKDMYWEKRKHLSLLFLVV